MMNNKLKIILIESVSKTYWNNKKVLVTDVRNLPPPLSAFDKPLSPLCGRPLWTIP